MPKSQGGDAQKTLTVDRFGKKQTLELRNTEEEGTSIVTIDTPGGDTSVGISNTVQGCGEGAWLQDSLIHLKAIAESTAQAGQELRAEAYTNLQMAREDVKAGRKLSPMLATNGNGHHGYWRSIEQGASECVAVSIHYGCIGPEVSNLIPMVDVDPNQSPLYQLTKLMKWQSSFTYNPGSSCRP